VADPDCVESMRKLPEKTEAAQILAYRYVLKGRPATTFD
jgi:hypothetical protein